MDAFSKAVEIKKDEIAPKLLSSKVIKSTKDGKEYLVVKFDKDVDLNAIDLAKMKSAGLSGKKYKDYVTTSVTIKAISVAKKKDLYL